MVQKVLVPLDGAPRAEASLAWATALHRAFGCDIVLLQVVERGPQRLGGFSGSVEWRMAQSEAAAYLSAVAGRLRNEGIGVEVDTAAGCAPDEILDAVHRHGVDLVLLTRHGQGEALEFPSGGTTAKLVSAAGTSLLLLPALQDGDVNRPIRRVIAPLDGSPRAEWALHLAASVASANEATLVLFHAVLRPEVLNAGQESEEASRLVDRLVRLNRSGGHRYLELKADQLSTGKLKVEVELVTTDNVPRAIHDAASREPGGLLVLSAHGRAGRAAWPYGGVACQLILHGTVPTLVFQDLPRRRSTPSRSIRRYARTPRSP
jgi:nucleotide-binding universal stress UspA family protein